jgi:hypothetical protein
MQIQHISLGFDGQEEEQIGTEIMLMEHETATRTRLVDAISSLEIPYDSTVFPERIILIGRYPVKAVHEIMTRRTRPDHRLPSFLPLLRAHYKKVNTKEPEEVNVSEKYL